MGIFRKKKEDEEELEKESSPKKKPVPRKSRKKKPPKPWGKKERYFVLGVFLATILLSGILAMSSRSWKLPGVPRVSFPKISFSSPNFSFLSSKKIVIEGNNENLDKGRGIVEDFKKQTNDLSGVYGLFVIQLSDGYSFGIYENDEFEPASLNKLPVVLAAYRQDEIGEFDLDDEYVLKELDKTKGSGSLASKPAGTTFTYRELVEYMCRESDNTAYMILKKQLGSAPINETIQEVGMTNTNPEENTTTPKDTGKLFESLLKGDLVEEKSRDEILSYLTDTIYENHLSQGVPNNIRVAHKYGREVHVLNDAGVVFSQNPYIVVIMTKGVVEKEADEIFPKLSEIVYQGLN